MAEPRVYNIPAGTSFVDALAAGLLAKFGSDPARLADVIVLLPNRRACRALGEAFLRQAAGKSMLLPRMRPLGDVDEEALIADQPGIDTEAVPPAISSLRRQLMLSQLVRKAAPHLEVRGADQALRLAGELARLLDEMQTAGVPFERLKTLVPEELAGHWQTTLAFLEIVGRQWPVILGAEGRIDPAERRNRLLFWQAEQWRKTPPGPVVAAGSTGSIPATAALLGVVAGLPEGMVVLPGLDRVADDQTWEAIEENHPQYALKALLERLGADRREVADWPGAGSETGRFRLLQDALRPAETWGETVVNPTVTSHLNRVDSPTPQGEAGVIALRMRAALDESRADVALVTRDRALARRVAAELRRWDLEVDDSAGTALAETQPGTFLRLIARMAAEQAAPVALLAVLKHPLAGGGEATGAFRTKVRMLERAALRGPKPGRGLPGIGRALRAANADAMLKDWWKGVTAMLEPMVKLGQRRRVAFADLLKAHVAVAEALAATDAEVGADRLWAREAGEQARELVAELAEAATAMPALRGADYPAVLDTLMSGAVVRPRYGAHPRLHIWGPLEARLQHADLVILGGMNEGSWPPAPAPDPWLSRPMRKALGLATPERRIGQAAHDFVQLAAGPNVMLTRAEKAEGSPTVPARWMERLQTLLEGAGLPGALTTEAPQWLTWHANLDRPTRIQPAPEPMPRPPVGKRPTQLSVTQVETWLRDPYGLYARRVLGLARLDPLEDDPDAKDRGDFIHTALDAFVKEFPDALPDDLEVAYVRLVAHGEAVFKAAIDRPVVQQFWWPRFLRIARWFVANEAERRERLASVKSEATGRLEIGTRAGPFMVTAKADRVERGKDGSLGLIDYKTGSLPAKKDIEDGPAVQMPLEAAIAAGGGFADVPAGAVGEVALWRLTGDEPPAEEMALDGAALGARARAGLAALAERFADPAMPYLACPRPQYFPRYNDYDHLERVDEWSQEGGDVPRFVPPPMDAVRPGAAGWEDPQRSAADPLASAWVGASAGTGKTKVLTDRVLRLLLSEVEPHRILALTFTKAAAAEMAVRIERQLGHWATMPEDELRQWLAGLMSAAPGADTVKLARRLFAQTIDAAGGLQIMTIHAFCQSLLGRFPLEADVAPGFAVADERTADEVQAAATDDVLAQAAGDGAGGEDTEEALGDDARSLLRAAVDRVARLARDTTFRSIVAELVAKRARLRAVIDRSGGVEGAIRDLTRRLGLEPGETEAGLKARAARLDPAHERALRAAVQAGLGTAKTYAERCLAIADWLAAGEAGRVAGLAEYRALYLTREGEIRKALCSKDTERDRPEIAAVLTREAERLITVEDLKRSLHTVEASAALLRFGAALLEAYARRKAERSLLDYEDLIEKAADLLTRSGQAAWVMFKLDGGIDHILVDEAQDTSPAQWGVIEALAEEFFVGQGAREGPRTLFVVGDEKQSIFSFQGADLEAFAAVKAKLAQRAAAAAMAWREEPLTASFRSVEAVLRAVDAVFARPEALAGVVSAGKIAHAVRRLGHAGVVELWPLVEPEESDRPDPWDVPDQYGETSDPEERLAKHVAATIEGWIGKERLESKARAVRAGDVLILVRRRSPFMYAVVRALRQRHVPVAGVDRMVLREPLAVRDLAALGRAALLPEDDLNLAAVLKGPLVGLDEDALMRLAMEREQGESLWRALARRAGEEDYGTAHAYLTRMAARADAAPPYAFLGEALATPPARPEDARSGKAALLARLGLEAEDPIEELLALALAYERQHAPSLEGFLHWLESAETEVKRDLEQGRDQVRVMTVHGAKGLQAPIVFLPDTAQVPVEMGPSMGWLPEDEGGHLLWAGKKALGNRRLHDAMDAARARGMAEYRRLLYVALTRAEDRLYVCGWKPGRKPGDTPWYDLVKAALEPIADERFDFKAWPGGALRLTAPQTAEPESRPAPASAAERVPDMPAGLLLPAPRERAADAPLAPSRLGEETVSAGGPPLATGEARRRGRVVHRMLELLPERPRRERRAAAERLATAMWPELPARERAALVKTVLGVLDDPALAELFGPGSRAEVAVAGVANVGTKGGRAVAGQVDRLVVTERAIVIADYKSDRLPPAEAAQVPQGYVRQLAAYRAVLQGVYPGRPVRCVLVWTWGPKAMELPEAMLDGAWG